jgi:addiction module HigA family antidote
MMDDSQTLCRRLTAEERERLLALISKGKASASALLKARILLKADADIKISKAQLAQHLHLDEVSIRLLLGEKKDLDANIACRLGQALGNGARFWLTLQMQYDIWKAEQNACDIAPLSVASSA